MASHENCDKAFRARPVCKRSSDNSFICLSLRLIAPIDTSVELGSTRLQICGCANITAGLRRCCWRGMAITHSKDSALLTHWFLRPSVGERLPVHKADRVMGSKPSIYCVPMMPTPPAWAYAWMGSRQTANGCAPG